MFVAPDFVKHESDKSWVWANYKKTFADTVVLVGAAALLVGLLAEPVIGFFYGGQYLNIVPLMNLLLITTFITNGLRYATANLLAAMGKIRVNMVVFALGILGQIALNLILVPQYGVWRRCDFNNCLRNDGCRCYDTVCDYVPPVSEVQRTA